MKRILIVDDEMMVRNVLREFLRKNNYVVDQVETGMQALSFIEQVPPDLILMDINMPGINGIETLTRIKETHPEICVIMLTGNDQNEIGQQAVQAGATDYLTKPISLAQLQTALAVHLLMWADD